MKMKNVLAGAVIATLAAVGSLAPAQTAVPEAQGGYAIGSIGAKLGWWGHNGYASAVSISVGAAGCGLLFQGAGAALGASTGKIGAMVGSAGGPIGLLIGAAIGAV